MEGCQSRSKLLDLIPRDKEWSPRRDNDEKRSHGCSEEKKLELRLGPPGGEDWPMENTEISNNIRKERRDQSLTCLGHFYSAIKKTEKMPFSPPSGSNTAGPHSVHKRSDPGPVVGWPPIRSFRKNLASTSSSKPGTESANAVQNNAVGEKPVETKRKGLFVKINAYDSYEQLSSAVDELFSGLLAAQRDSSNAGNKKGEESPITGLLDGIGEYSLVYEDNEGDKMLVGDVPWHMFVLTVKRLSVLKSSELSSALTIGSSKQGKKTA